MSLWKKKAEGFLSPEKGGKILVSGKQYSKARLDFLIFFVETASMKVVDVDVLANEVTIDC